MAFLNFKDPANVPIRPLDKGMLLNVPSKGLAMGAFVDLQNYIASQRGLTRRSGLNQLMGSNQTNALDQPLIDLVPLWKTDGTQIAALLTSRYFYQFNLYSSPSVKYWQGAAASVGTVANTGAAVTGTSTRFESAHADGWAMAGDFLVIDPGGSDTGPETVEIASVASDTALTLVSAPTKDYSGEDYYIQHAFQVDDNYLIDSTVVGGVTNKIIMADRARPPYTYDGTTFTTLLATMLYCPATVLYFGGSRSDRLWIANTKEVTAASDISTYLEYRHRIRWSSATDVTSFTATDSIDLPYTSSEIKKLLNIGHIIMVYLGDAVFYGRPANIVGLPYVFDRMGTSGIGLVGPKAITSYMDTHFWVGQDDIYVTGGDLQRVPIGTPVVKETIDQCEYPGKVYVCPDVSRHRILFGFPRSSETIERIWSFDYRAKSWSYEEIDASFIANPLLDLGLAWSDLGSTLSVNTWTGFATDFPSWGAISASAGASKKVYIGSSGYVYEYDESLSTDEGVLIEGKIESGDMDLNLPNKDKTYLRLSMALEERPSADLAFTLETSIDGGNNWVDQGSLSINSDKREGWVDMLASGSYIRFRLTSTSNVEPYIITEFVWRLVESGDETDVD